MEPGGACGRGILFGAPRGVAEFEARTLNPELAPQPQYNTIKGGMFDK